MSAASRMPFIRKGSWRAVRSGARNWRTPDTSVTPRARRSRATIRGRPVSRARRSTCTVSSPTTRQRACIEIIFPECSDKRGPPAGAAPKSAAGARSHVCGFETTHRPELSIPAFAPLPARDLQELAEVAFDRLADGGRRCSGIRVRSAGRFRDDLVDELELLEVGGRVLERLGGFFLSRGVLPEDRGARLGRDHRVD